MVEEQFFKKRAQEFWQRADEDFQKISFANEGEKIELVTVQESSKILFERE